MSLPKNTHPSTKGDHLVNTIYALGEMRHIATRLNKTIGNLNDFVKDSINDGTNKQIIVKQIRLIERTSIYMSDKLKYVTGQQQFKVISERIESRKRAASRIQFKIESKLN